MNNPTRSHHPAARLPGHQAPLPDPRLPPWPPWISVTSVFPSSSPRSFSAFLCSLCGLRVPASRRALTSSSSR